LAAIADAAAQAAPAAGSPTGATSGNVTWTYYQHGHLSGAADIGTPPRAPEHLYAAIAWLTGIKVTREAESPLLRVSRWLLAPPGTMQGDRLMQTVQGLLPIADAFGSWTPQTLR
jgi:hypothetical protein